MFKKITEIKNLIKINIVDDDVNPKKNPKAFDFVTSWVVDRCSRCSSSLISGWKWEDPRSLNSQWIGSSLPTLWLAFRERWAWKFQKPLWTVSWASSLILPIGNARPDISEADAAEGPFTRFEFYGFSGRAEQTKSCLPWGIGKSWGSNNPTWLAFDSEIWHEGYHGFFPTITVVVILRNAWIPASSVANVETPPPKWSFWKGSKGSGIGFHTTEKRGLTFKVAGCGSWNEHSTTPGTCTNGPSSKLRQPKAAFTNAHDQNLNYTVFFVIFFIIFPLF